MKFTTKTPIKQPLLFSLYLYNEKYSKERLVRMTFSIYVVTLH